MRCQPSNQMFDVDWLPHPASWPNSSSFHPDALETHTGNLMKLVPGTEEGVVIFSRPAGGEVTSDFSPVWSRISSRVQSQTCFSPFTPSLRNYIWTLSSSPRLLRGCWGGVREAGSGGGAGLEVLSHPGFQLSWKSRGPNYEVRKTWQLHLFIPFCPNIQAKRVSQCFPANMCPCWEWWGTQGEHTLFCGPQLNVPYDHCHVAFHIFSL